ncbi:gluconokinase [Nocardia shimofusensis]|uniref:gluconokinase n=1 Tax=Nocardia shimofusensis TaxID=228596 RepID=UPI0008314EBA|nr:gluconokinase [Nocardia shimofusensis]
MADHAIPPPVVVMGVSGSGKTTVAARLAAALGVPFAEGDDFHPAANIAAMAAGIALTDADRAPWLDRIADRLTRATDGVVVSCSALARSYRDRLRADVPDLVFVHLDVPRAEVDRQLRHRGGHFMPPSLLDSQLATLEPLDADEAGIVVDATDTPEALADRVAAWLRSRL